MPGFVMPIARGLAPEGDLCVVCNITMRAGDTAAICSVDRAIHHVGCWEWNGNHCGANLCPGEGDLIPLPPGMAFSAYLGPAKTSNPAETADAERTQPLRLPGESYTRPSLPAAVVMQPQQRSTTLTMYNVPVKPYSEMAQIKVG